MTLHLKPSRLVQETMVAPLGEESTLLFRPNPDTDITALTLVFPMGSREEPPELAGLSTLALQMLSRGTKRLNDFELAVAFESLGATFGTDAQKDRATITVQALADQWNPMLALVREVLTEPSFPLEDFETEKEILIKEIREDNDSPNTAAHRLFRESLFGGHPYAHSSQGTEESVARITHDHVRDWYFSRIGGLRMSIAVVGNLDEDQVFDGLAETLESLPEPDDFDLREGIPLQPLDTGLREVWEEREMESECLVFGFPVPGFRSDSFFSWKVLDSIVGGSMDSRLFSEVREKRGLVYQIGSSYPPLEWQSCFAISLVTTQANHGEVLECIHREVDRLKTTLPEGDELDRAKTYLKGTFLMAQERVADQAHLLARYHSLGLGVEFIDEYPRGIDQVRAEDIRSAAEAELKTPLIAGVGRK